MEPSTILECFYSIFAGDALQADSTVSSGVRGFFLIWLAGSSFRAFAFPPSPAGQASPAVNLLGEPHTLANPLRSRAGSPKHGLHLKPPAPDGTRTQAIRTIPSQPDLPSPSYSIPSTRRQARRISCIAQYLF